MLPGQGPIGVKAIRRHAKDNLVRGSPANPIGVPGIQLHVPEGASQSGGIRFPRHAVEHGDHHGPAHGDPGAKPGIAHTHHPLPFQYIVHPGVIPRRLGQVLEGRRRAGPVVHNLAGHRKGRAVDFRAAALQLLGRHLEGVATGLPRKGQG